MASPIEGNFNSLCQCCGRSIHWHFTTGVLADLLYRLYHLDVPIIPHLADPTPPSTSALIVPSSSTRVSMLAWSTGCLSLAVLYQTLPPSPTPSNNKLPPRLLMLWNRIFSAGRPYEHHGSTSSTTCFSSKSGPYQRYASDTSLNSGENKSRRVHSIRWVTPQPHTLFRWIVITPTQPHGSLFLIACRTLKTKSLTYLLGCKLGHYSAEPSLSSMLILLSN